MSTIKSNSSKGGQGFNEFRFEDKKGSEQVFLHAEKDQDIRVKERFQRMDRQRPPSRSSRRTSTRLVEKDKHTHVKGDQLLKVDGNYRSTSLQKMKSPKSVGNDHLAVDGDYVLKIGGNLHEKVDRQSSRANHRRHSPHRHWQRGHQSQPERRRSSRT